MGLKVKRKMTLLGPQGWKVLKKMFHNKNNKKQLKCELL